MATINDPRIRELLEAPNYAVVSTNHRDGSIHSTVIWLDVEGENLAINSAVGRVWPTNLERDPHVSLLVQETGNPYRFVEIRGTATGSTDGADEHINRLAKKYLGKDEYPYRQPGEQRIKFLVTPEHVRYVNQG